MQRRILLAKAMLIVVVFWFVMLAFASFVYATDPNLAIWNDDGINTVIWDIFEDYEGYDAWYNEQDVDAECVAYEVIPGSVHLSTNVIQGWTSQSNQVAVTMGGPNSPLPPGTFMTVGYLREGTSMNRRNVYRYATDSVTCLTADTYDPYTHDTDGDGVPDAYDAYPYDPDRWLAVEETEPDDQHEPVHARFTQSVYQKVENPEYDPNDPLSSPYTRGDIVYAEITTYNSRYSVVTSHEYGDRDYDPTDTISVLHAPPDVRVSDDAYFPAHMIDSAVSQESGHSDPLERVTSGGSNIYHDPVLPPGETDWYYSDNENFVPGEDADHVVDPETGEVEYIDYSGQLKQIGDMLYHMAQDGSIDYSQPITNIGENIAGLSGQMNQQITESERLTAQLRYLNEQAGRGFGLGDDIGDAFGDALGLGEGQGIGDAFGDALGLGEGQGIGDAVGDGIGDALGLGEGQGIGDAVGDGVGDALEDSGLFHADQSDVDAIGQQPGQVSSVYDDMESGFQGEQFDILQDAPQEYQDQIDVDSWFTSLFANNPISHIIESNQVQASGSPSASFQAYGQNIELTMAPYSDGLTMFGNILIMITTFAGFLMVIRG